MRILIIALVFISSVAKGQIQDFQLKGKIPKDTLWIMGTDTASASNKYGLGKWHNADSLISRRAKDYDFFGLGTGEPPLMNEDSIETADTMYVLFHGLEGGIHQKIEMLKEGTIQFDKGDDDASRYLYYIKAKPLQQGEGNPNFNFTIATTDIATDKNNDVAMIGWNVSPGGGREISGESMLAIAFENQYYNAGNLYNEFHILHTDTAGNARRPFTLFLDKGNPDVWEGAFHVPKFDFRPPDDTDPYVTIRLAEDTIPQMRFRNPVTNFGFNIESNPNANTAKINNDGMTNPTLYFQSWQQAEFSSKLKYTTEGTATPNKLVGKDADGFLRTFDWGVVVDSIETNGVGLWTDAGSNMYPTGNEAIHMPSTLGSSTGNLNLIGRFDQAFPTSSLNNIAIGQSAGHGSLAGDDNIYIGRNSGESNTAGSNNINIGYQAGSQFTGSSSVAIGYQAMLTNVSGSRNVAIGDRALMDVTGGDNLAVGSEAGTNISSGSGNLAYGTSSLYSITTGGNNVGIGKQAGNNTQSGSRNVLVGALSGYGNGAANNSAQDNTIIGYEAGFSLNGDGNIFIGRSSGANETGSNKLYIDNSNTATPLILGDFAADSLLINGKLGFTTTAGTANSITGRLGTQFTNVGTGWGIDLTSGNLVVDSSQVATQYDLTTISGGSTDLTIGGSGPTYTIESSTGTDVTIAANPGISLGESPANTLVISNDGVVEGVNASDATHHYFDLLDFSASSLGTLTLTEGTNITLTTSGTSANGIVTIAATEVDGSVTNEAWTIDGDDADTELISNQTYKFEGAGILTTDVVPASDKIILTATEVDGSTTNELFEIEENNVSEGTDMLRLDFLNPFDVAVVGAEADVSLDLDEISTDAAWEGDEYLAGSDGAATNEKFEISTILNTIEEGNVSVQTDNTNIDFGSILDVTTDGTGEVNVDIDFSEATTVTAVEADDYMMMWDNGSTAEQKMLWSDFTIDLIDFQEDNVSEGTGNTIDLGTGLDGSYASAEYDISLDFNELTTDAATEGDEYVILYDPSAADEEKVLISSIGGADGNGIYDGDGTVPSDLDATLTNNARFGDGSENDFYIDATNDKIGMGTGSPQYGLHVTNSAGAAFDYVASGENIVVKIEGSADGGSTNTAESSLLFNYADADYASGAEQEGAHFILHKESDAAQWTTMKVTMKENTDADALVIEKNVDLGTSSDTHLAMNGGIAFTQNYDVSTGGSDLNLDRSYYTINITGGNLTDTIKLPEVASTVDNWTSALTSTQCQVGQEYVISNLRAATNLVIGAYNPAGTSDDLIGTRTAPGGSAGSAISIAPGKSVIIKCYQLAGGIGYWNYWLSN